MLQPPSGRHRRGGRRRFIHLLVPLTLGLALAFGVVAYANTSGGDRDAEVSASHRGKGQSGDRGNHGNRGRDDRGNRGHRGHTPVHPHRNAYRITTDPDPYEQFNISLGMRAGNLLFISGQAAIDEQGQIVGEGDFDAQADAAFQNLERVLKAGGSDLSKVVKVNIYLTDMGNFPKILQLREKYFTKPYPADTIVEISQLGLPELMIEIEAVAIAKGKIIDPGPDALAR